MDDKKQFRNFDQRTCRVSRRRRLARRVDGFVILIDRYRPIITPYPFKSSQALRQIRYTSCIKLGEACRTKNPLFRH